MNERLQSLLRHIANVREHCLLVGQKLLEQGEVELGRKIIANGCIHDNSKFRGIEWLYLHEDVKWNTPSLFKAAVHQHVTTNLHHPDAWSGGIRAMTQEYVGEMVCDWAARSIELGNNLDWWIGNVALDKFNFSTSCQVYRDIRRFRDLLV